MRKDVIEKIEYFYGDRIGFLKSCYENLNYLEFNFEMIGVSNTMSSPTDQDNTIYLNKTIGYNSQLILPEIIDDFNCSLDLIKSTYFKQSNQILRNCLELTSQLLYTKYILEDGNDITSWINGNRGVDSLLEMTEHIKNRVPNKYKFRIREIVKFYNLLNRSTHSHKNHLNIKGISKFDKFGVFGFEYSEFHNSFLIHLCCLDIFLDIIKYFYSTFTSDFFTDEVIRILESIQDKLAIFSKEIENYKKGDYEKGEGYLIYRKHMTINNKSILYSFKANKEILWPSKNKGKQSDRNKIYDEIDKELIKKKITFSQNSGD